MCEILDNINYVWSQCNSEIMKLTLNFKGRKPARVFDLGLCFAIYGSLNLREL